MVIHSEAQRCINVHNYLQLSFLHAFYLENMVIVV